MKKFLGTETALVPIAVFGLLALAGVRIAPVVWGVFAVALASGVVVDVLRARSAQSARSA